jgi:hypothetical protein
MAGGGRAKMMAWWYALPDWIEYLVYGLSLFFLMCFSSIILGRAGRNPYWALLAIVPLPFFFAALLWIFAFTRWPRRDGQSV